MDFNRSEEDSHQLLWKTP